MLGARYYGRRDLRLEEVREPEAGPGDVKLRVLYAGHLRHRPARVILVSASAPTVPHRSAVSWWMS